MPTRTTPTQRQKRLGAELRRLRTEAGMSTEYAAGLLGLDRTKISNIEAGVRGITPERLRILACNYDCSDEAYIDALAAMAGRAPRGWWESYRGSLPSGLLDIAELEWHATRLRTAQTVHVPGLLHTEDYATAIFRAALPPLPEEEIERRTAHRRERQRVLERSEPPEYVAFIHEAALRMRFGGSAVMRRQLTHIAAMSEADRISVRVLPVAIGAFPGAGHALLYAHGEVPRLDTAQLDSAHGPEFTFAESQLAKYRSHLDWMDETALPEAESRDFIQRIIEQL
ncbi:helix-turn-helix domain-containing protein [Streptomyces sp. 6N223]|uniref:helix-turn-helix domain-containing protein n=1 Tax=Streptomyces sp. 6N223 TaxID=3457412 RepID=UPI003FCFA8EA